MNVCKPSVQSPDIRKKMKMLKTKPTKTRTKTNPLGSLQSSGHIKRIHHQQRDPKKTVAPSHHLKKKDKCKNHLG